MMTLSCAESCNIYEINALYTYGKSSVYTPRKTYTTFVVQYSGKGDFLGQHAGVQDIFIFSPLEMEKKWMQWKRRQRTVLKSELTVSVHRYETHQHVTVFVY